GRAGRSGGIGVARAVSETVGLYTNDSSGVFQRSVISGAVEVVERAGLGFTVAEVAERVSSAEGAAGLTAGTLGSLIITNVLGYEALRSLSDARHPLTLVSHRA